MFLYDPSKSFFSYVTLGGICSKVSSENAIDRFQDFKYNPGKLSIK